MDHLIEESKANSGGPISEESAGTKRAIDVNVSSVKASESINTDHMGLSIDALENEAFPTQPSRVSCLKRSRIPAVSKTEYRHEEQATTDDITVAEQNVMKVDAKDIDISNDEASDSKEVNKLCMAEDRCVTRSKHYRKVVSQVFGRNKSCTTQIPEHCFLFYCRQHYQRFYYRHDIAWGIWVIGLTRVQIKRLEDWGGVIDWEIALRLTEKKILDKENAAIAAEDARKATILESKSNEFTAVNLSKTRGGSSSVSNLRSNMATPFHRRTCRERYLVPYLGRHKSFDDLRAVIDAIEAELTPVIAEMEANGKTRHNCNEAEKKAVSFPGVEFLPRISTERYPSKGQQLRQMRQLQETKEEGSLSPLVSNLHPLSAGLSPPHSSLAVPEEEIQHCASKLETARVSLPRSAPTSAFPSVPPSSPSPLETLANFACSRERLASEICSPEDSAAVSLSSLMAPPAKRVPNKETTMKREIVKISSILELPAPSTIASSSAMQAPQAEPETRKRKAAEMCLPPLVSADASLSSSSMVPPAKRPRNHLGKRKTIRNPSPPMTFPSAAQASQTPSVIHKRNDAEIPIPPSTSASASLIATQALATLAAGLKRKASDDHLNSYPGLFKIQAKMSAPARNNRSEAKDRGGS